MSDPFAGYDAWKTTDPRYLEDEPYDEEEAYAEALDSELLRQKSMQEYEQVCSAGWLMFEMQR